MSSPDQKYDSSTERNDEKPQQQQRSSSNPKARRKSGLASLGRASVPRTDGKVELTEQDAWDKTGYTFPTWKKWTILCVIFAVQSSMNFNTSVYPNAIKPLSKHYGISQQAARVGQMIFLVSYSFGCELWAPWSEEFGRRPILQLSLFLINIWQLPCALSQNFGTLVVGRFFGGLCTAGGSVTLGMVADMWKADDQQYAVAFVVLSSVGGTTIGPIFGGFIEKYLDWRWNFWIQLIFGGFTQLIHFFLVPETRTTILLDKEAKRRRKAGESHIYGPSELKEQRLDFKEVMIIWSRPFEMFIREPIVLCLSLLSGFSDALIFTFLEGFQPVFEQWNFGVVEIGLAFCSYVASCSCWNDRGLLTHVRIFVGYLLCYASFIPVFRWQANVRRKDPDKLQPEARLWWLLFSKSL